MQNSRLLNCDNHRFSCSVLILEKYTFFYFIFACIHVHRLVCVSAYYKHMYNVSVHEGKIPAEILSPCRVENLSPQMVDTLSNQSHSCSHLMLFGFVQ